MKLKLSFLFLFLILFLFSFTAVSESSNVVVVEITGTIDQGTVEILKESMRLAESKNSEAIILLLDTPGGGLSETFEIAELINESKIPVVGYVYPSGSAAWSAGTFILMSTHIAAMADHTIIGSCQPVEVSITGTKMINDSKTINALTSWMKERANMYGRNTTIAKRFITENLNINETLALKYGAIDFSAPSVGQLLQDINGTVVKTNSGDVTLNTRYAKQIKYEPSLGIQLMKFFSNPALTSILLLLGVFAIIFGISAPGFGAEVFGVIAVLLALVGSGFSISALALIFIVVGFILLIIEIFAIPGFGVVGIGGIISLIIGSAFLIPDYHNRNWLVSMDVIGETITVVIVIVILIALFFAFMLYKVLEARRKRVAIGLFSGETAKTVDRITPDKPGYVRYKGELWQATSDTTIEPNTKVIIIEKNETTLKIKPKDV